LPKELGLSTCSLNHVPASVFLKGGYYSPSSYIRSL
jgi:hypothetical protein